MQCIDRLRVPTAAAGCDGRVRLRGAHERQQRQAVQPVPAEGPRGAQLGRGPDRVGPGRAGARRLVREARVGRRGRAAAAERSAAVRPGGLLAVRGARAARRARLHRHRRTRRLRGQRGSCPRAALSPSCCFAFVLARRANCTRLVFSARAPLPLRASGILFPFAPRGIIERRASSGALRHWTSAVDTACSFSLSFSFSYSTTDKTRH